MRDEYGKKYFLDKLYKDNHKLSTALPQVYIR